MDFFTRRLTLPGNVSVLLQASKFIIWDIGGQSIASPMLEKYINGAHGAVVVYDVTNSSSFENLEDWINIIKQVTKTQERPVVLMLVGNKTDLEHRRVIRIERHTKFALQYGMSSYYVSAKTGDSVTLMFRKTAAEILGIPLEQSDTEGDIIVVKASVTTRTEDESQPSQQQLRADQSRNTTVCSVIYDSVLGSICSTQGLSGVYGRLEGEKCAVPNVQGDRSSHFPDTNYDSFINALHRTDQFHYAHELNIKTQISMGDFRGNCFGSKVRRGAVKYYGE
ncbi:unnamed protein product [Wuchereria bancrofti]|uniref:Ras family protein n=1 Tax=Wuchereria bancrofti TaxID=6293 RepID=A0A3P7DSZ4_WUCBA|nr:unnamed protein product [Wuchereria bancrofti]